MSFSDTDVNTARKWVKESRFLWVGDHPRDRTTCRAVIFFFLFTNLKNPRSQRFLVFMEPQRRLRGRGGASGPQR